MTSYTQDVSANIKGFGSNYNLIPTASTGYQYASGSVMSSGSYNWANNGYTTSNAMSGSITAGAVVTSTANFSSQPFVIETWIKFTGDIYPTVGPPFNQFVFGEISGDYFLTDYSGGAGAYRFFTFGGAQLQGTTTYNKDIWYSLVFVKSVSGGGAVQSIYLNGNRIATASFPNNTITPAPQGFYSLLGTGVGENDAGSHQIQDFRMYIGTNKGYGGTTIPIPESIVTLSS